MAQSIGELFVSLGFEVDDTKLKSFDESIKGAMNSVLKFAGVSASAAGMLTLATNASDTALKIEHMTSVFGTSTKAMQAWAAAVHETWPQTSFSGGLDSFKRISEYIGDAVTSPSGTIALRRLGVNFAASDIQHPEKVLNQLYDRIPALLAQHPENRFLYSKLIGELTGDPGNIAVFEKGRAFSESAAAHATVYQDDLDKELAARQAISGLQDSWDKFVAHATASLAPGLTGLLGEVDKGKGFWDSLKRGIDYIGANSPVMGDSHIGHLVGKWNSKNQSYLDSVAFWEAHGMTDAQVDAWTAQEEAESGGNPRAENSYKGKLYKGLFQWSPERAAAILKGTGIDINTANHWQQLQAAAWEFHNKGLDKNFPSSSAADASKFLSDKFEIHEKWNKQHGDETAYRQKLAENQPDVNVTVVQNIHSSADAEEVARVAEQRMSDTITAAFNQRIGVNP